MKITANFNNLTGIIKPMHAVGQPPFSGSNFSMFRYLTDAHIPYSRLHDVGGWLGGDLYVDIPNLFRDFDADENLPENYDFAFTDRLLKAMCDAKVEPFFRLGITIENSFELRKYRTDPPKDFGKWARICEHVVRHYNEGWANGYHMGITYWEIWNEPEPDCDEPEKGTAMWSGTAQQFYELYEAASKHLKACFGDSIKVGGYGSCGFYVYSSDPDCTGRLTKPFTRLEWLPEKLGEYYLIFAHGFLKFVKERNCPLDFFSWHSYDNVEGAVGASRYCRKMLAKYGFENVPDVLDEWNALHDLKLRASQRSAAETLCFMLAMQKEAVSEMNYYDARISAGEYGGMFNPDTWQPYPCYYAFRAFGNLYKLKNEVETASDGDSLYVGGARDGKHASLVIANLTAEPVSAELDVTGLDFADATVIRLDDEGNRYTVTDEEIGKTVRLPAYGVIELRF